MDFFDIPCFRIIKPCLSLIGLWPYETTFVRTLKILLAAIGLIFMCAPMLIFVFKHFDDLDGLLELMPTMAGGLTCTTKFFSIIYHSKKFKILLQQIYDDWVNVSSVAERTFRKYMEITRKFILIYAISIITFVSCFALLALFNPLLDVVLPRNETRPRKFSHPAEYPVDEEKYYYSLLMSMYYGYIICLVIVVGIDTTYFVAIRHACTLFGILSYHLENMVQVRSEDSGYDLSLKQDKVVRHLAQCVRLHVNIKMFIELIETVFAIFLILEVGLGFIMHCTLCIVITLRINQTLEFVVCLTLVLCQSGRLFLHCWAGQQVTDHSTGIYIAAYNGPWYKASKTVKKLFLILIAKSQTICEITIARSFVVNIESFVMIMKTSLSFCTIMISIREESNGT